MISSLRYYGFHSKLFLAKISKRDRPSRAREQGIEKTADDQRRQSCSQ